MTALSVAASPADAATACPNCGSDRKWQRNGVKRGKMQFKARCVSCHKASLAVQRAKHGGAAARNKVWENENREAALAHRKVEFHLKAGNIARKPCERCGSINSQAHHDDYSVALEVRWLCPAHHAERHRELQSAAADLAASAVVAPPAIVLAASSCERAARESEAA